jgi:hypothetical protein
LRLTLNKPKLLQDWIFGSLDLLVPFSALFAGRTNEHTES